jgi:RNA polymerase sigma-70 factor (ECF subfamily)
MKNTTASAHAGDPVSKAAAGSPQDDHDDAELLRRSANHDAGAFDLLADRFRDALHRHVASILGADRAATDDVLQDALLQVWLRAASWDGRGSAKAWLFKVATNTALNRRRTVLRRREISLVPASPSADDDAPLPAWMADSTALAPDDQAVRRDEHERFLRVVADLPDEKREVLRLICDEERDIREAASILGIPSGTVKSRLFHARKQIARNWPPDELP